MTINGGILRTTATMTIDDAAHTITTGSAGGTVQTAAGTTLTLSQPITSTAGSFFKTGTGTLGLTVGSTFAGQTVNVMEGTMRTAGSAFNILGFSQNIFIGEGATLSASNTANNAHNFQALSMTGGTLTSSGAASEGGFGHWLLNANVTTNASALQSTISAGRVNLVSTRTFTVANGAAPIDLLVSSELFGSALIKEGLGLMALSGNNTYSGATTINSGTLSIDAENRLGVNPGAFNAAQFTLNGGTLQTTASFAIDDANRGITVGALGGTIETATGTTLNVARPITSTVGVAGLTKTGAGAMDLTVANNFTNSTLTVNSGTVNITALQTFGGGTLVVNSGTVNLASVNTFNLLSGNPNIVIGSGATVSAANTTANNAHNIGSLTMTGGTLTSNAVSDVANGHWLLNGNVTTNASALTSNITAGRVRLVGTTTFSVADGAAAVDLQISSQLFGGNLTKSGAGTMVLTGPNSFTTAETVRVDQGTLRAEGTNFNVFGGAHVVVGQGAVLNASNSANNAHNVSTVTLTGGTITSNAVDNTTFGNFLFNGNVTTNASATTSTISAVRVGLQGVRTFTVADGSAAVDLAVSSILFNGNAIATAGVTKEGSGVMSLSGANVYNGATTVNAGTLRADGVHSGAGNYTVASGAKLGGSGSINLASGASINVLPAAGIVSPGPGFSGTNPANIADVGTLTVNAATPASLALDMNGILQIDIVSPVQYDVLNIADGTIDIDPGAVININGQTNLSQLNLGVLGFKVGDRINLLLADQILGNFGNFPANQQINTAGGSVFFGNSGAALFLVATPEPSTVVLWSLVSAVVLVLICCQRLTRSAG